MKKRMRAGVLLLALLLCGGAFASCKKEQQTNPSGTKDYGEEETLDPNSEEAIYLPSTEKFDDFEFKILAQTTYFYQSQWAWNEADGDAIGVMDSAVYARQELLREKYGIDVYQANYTGSAYDALSRACMSNYYLYDIVAINTIDSMAAAQAGFLYDVNTLKGLNLEASYYDQNIQQEYKLGSYLFQLEGDFSYIDDLRTMMMYYNDTVYKDYNYYETYGTPYEMVESGTWTVERLSEMIKGLGRENGDGTWDDQDSYGWISSSTDPYVLYLAAGMKTFENRGGTLESTLTNQTTLERTVNLIQEFGQLIRSQDVILIDAVSGSTDEEKSAKTSDIFKYNRAMFRSSTLSSVLRLMDMKTDYGVLPMPKYTVEQEDYYCYVSAKYSEPVAFASDAQPDIERAARAFEIFAYHSRYINSTTVKSMHSAFFDTLAEFRLCRSAVDSQMMELILSSKVFDVDDALSLTSLQNSVMGFYYQNTYDKVASTIGAMRDASEYKGQLIIERLKETLKNR